MQLITNRFTGHIYSTEIDDRSIISPSGTQGRIFFKNIRDWSSEGNPSVLAHDSPPKILHVFMASLMWNHAGRNHCLLHYEWRVHYSAQGDWLSI